MTEAIAKPNFFVIGAHKAGTTSLCELLGSHPDVFMCDPKEPGFFSHERKHRLGYEWYASLFQAAGGHAAVGEGSTTYSQTGIYPKVVERIAAYAPDSRIIYITRSPLERLESAWIEWRNMGRKISGSFPKALRTWPALIDSALYWKQISAYRARWPDERILVLFFEDFKADPRAVLRRTYRFLGVDEEHEPPDPDRPRRAWSDGRREDRALLGAMRRVPGYDRVRDTVIPRGWRRRFKSLFRRPIRERPGWDEPSRVWVVEQIGEDVRRFLEHYGKPPDFWSLEAPASIPG
ncbi:MAG: sulfotransferase family protein [Planctomycetota bacterium]